MWSRRLPGAVPNGGRRRETPRKEAADVDRSLLIDVAVPGGEGAGKGAGFSECRISAETIAGYR